MRCSERAVLDYLDNAVSSAQRSELEAHMVTCVTCRLQLASFRKTLELADEVQLPALSPLHANSVVHRVRNQLASRGSGFRTGSGWSKLWAPTLSGAIGGAVLVVALLSALDWPLSGAQPGAESAVVSGIDAEARVGSAVALEEFDTGEDLDSGELALQLEEYLMATASGSELFEEADSFVLDTDDYYSLLEVY